MIGDKRTSILCDRDEHEWMKLKTAVASLAGSTFQRCLMSSQVPAYLATTIQYKLNAWSFMAIFCLNLKREREGRRAELLIWSFGPLRLSCSTSSKHLTDDFSRDIAFLWEIILLGEMYLNCSPSSFSTSGSAQPSWSYFLLSQSAVPESGRDTTRWSFIFVFWIFMSSLSTHMNSFRFHRRRFMRRCFTET